MVTVRQHSWPGSLFVFPSPSVSRQPPQHCYAHFHGVRRIDDVGIVDVPTLSTAGTDLQSHTESFPYSRDIVLLEVLNLHLTGAFRAPASPRATPRGEGYGEGWGGDPARVRASSPGYASYRRMLAESQPNALLLSSWTPPPADFLRSDFIEDLRVGGAPCSSTVPPPCSSHKHDSRNNSRGRVVVSGCFAAFVLDYILSTDVG